MEMPALSAFYAIAKLLGLYLHGKNRVGARTCFVVESWSNMPTFGPFPEDLHRLLALADYLLSDSFNVNTLF